MGNYTDAASISYTTGQDQYQLIDNDGWFWASVLKFFHAYAHARVTIRHSINEESMTRNAFHFQTDKYDLENIFYASKMASELCK